MWHVLCIRIRNCHNHQPVDEIWISERQQQQQKTIQGLSVTSSPSACLIFYGNFPMHSYRIECFTMRNNLHICKIVSASSIDEARWCENHRNMSFCYGAVCVWAFFCERVYKSKHENNILWNVETFPNI